MFGCCRFGFNNGQTMVDGLYAGSTFQVSCPLSPIIPIHQFHIPHFSSPLPRVHLGRLFMKIVYRTSRLSQFVCKVKVTRKIEFEKL